MNYKKIRELLNRDKSDRKLFFDEVGMSKIGFYKMMKLESCKVSTLEAIARYFEKPVDFFFCEEEIVNQVKTEVAPQASKPACHLETYQKLIAEKDALITQQKEFIRLILECRGSSNAIKSPE